MKKSLLFTIALFAAFAMQSCKDDNVTPDIPDPGNTVSMDCEGIYFGDAFFPNDVVYTHYLRIGDKPLTEAGGLYYEGTYYILRINAPLESFPAPGDYTLTSTPDKYTEFTILGGDLSYVVQEGMNYYIEEAAMTVARQENGRYTIEITLTSTEGRKFHTVYDGEFWLTDKSIEWVADDMDTQITKALSWYLEDGADGANLNITLYENLDASGFPAVPSNVLILVGNGTFNDDGELQPGTFPIGVGAADENWFTPGECVNFLNAPFPVGSNLRYYYQADANGQSIQVGLVESGTVNIEKNEGIYTLTYDFVTNKGKKVKGTYTGPIDVKDAPRVVESHEWDLKEDHVLTFESENIKVSAFSDKYTVEGALVWKIQIQQYDANWSWSSDQLIVSIVNSLEESEAPAPGIYRVSKHNEMGTVLAGEYFGTFGLGTFFQHYEDGAIVSAGAAFDGEMALSKNGDGTYTIEFDFIDEQIEPKHFSGTWTGKMEIW